MGIGLWATLLAALLSGSALPWVLRAMRAAFSGEGAAQSAMLEAEARKFNAEAGSMNWQTLCGEIRRLQKRVDTQDRRIAELEKLDLERNCREIGLNKENGDLSANVHSLEERVFGLEKHLRMIAAELHRIDRTNPKLLEVATALNIAFDFDPSVPDDMAAKLDKMP